jgi:hypothetical protein
LRIALTNQGLPGRLKRTPPPRLNQKKSSIRLSNTPRRRTSNKL